MKFRISETLSNKGQKMTRWCYVPDLTTIEGHNTNNNTQKHNFKFFMPSSNRGYWSVSRYFIDKQHLKD